MSGQSQRVLSINHYCCELMLSCSRTRPGTPSENQTPYLSIRSPVAIVLHKVLINSRETGMFMKVFSDIFVYRVSLIYIH